MTAAKPTLTKSLHTITAVVNVAAYIRNGAPEGITAAQLAESALAILGYDIETFSKNDVTVQRCVAGCAKLLAGAK